MNIKRFSISQIAVHAVAAASILLLYFTGLPMTFPEQLGWIPAILGGYEVTMFIHRIAAFCLIVSGIYFVIHYLLNGILVRKSLSTGIFPKIQDVWDAINDTLRLFRLPLGKDQIPKFGKYTWIAKFEFWSIFFEGGIFIITGIILWFPFQFMAVMPKDYIAAAKIIHAGFAIISICGVSFHSYMVHFNPARFRIDRSVFSGEMPEEEAKEMHPKWYEEIKGGEHVQNT
ncbi:MAG: cytochrome b/b6 domain-containing protein [Euryarchaeota archaeon]|nr:cytochrome b/b6 domain-containing protein [Euryarchaeota archaeon]